MGLFYKLFAGYRGSWCKTCRRRMEKADRRLFALPDLSVGHYVEYTDAACYRRELCAVSEKADIPPGMYACRAILFRCPSCGRRTTVLTPFLPVRDEEKHERIVVFKNGELDDFLWE